MKPRILLADDAEDILELTSAFIRTMTGVDPEIELCPNGEKAIDALKASVHKKFDVVLTDFEMGIGPDGVDVASEAIRQKIAKIFVSTCYEFKILNTSAAKRLREADGWLGVKVMKKLEIDDLERHIIPILVSP